jgi:hypothetical protein
MSMAISEELTDNPLVIDAPFPIFDKIEAKHVVPGMQSLLQELVQSFFQ